ncbi:MAG TPA: hypothetical protein VMI47_01395, partial [Pseudolabrys sp.]|nr:hypothetical protein [Pseudolabrys sp.]
MTIFKMLVVFMKRRKPAGRFRILTGGHRRIAMSRKSFGEGDSSFEANALSRRRFVSVAAATAAALALPGTARAQKKFDGSKVVFASWGGSYQDAQKQAFCEPFASATGASV